MERKINKTTNNNTDKGVNFLGLLFLLFLGLKLAGKIDWSWIWVFSPIWGPFALAGLVFVIVLIFKTVKESTKGD